MEQESKGRLTVRTESAGGALPVKNSIVRIRGAMEKNRDVQISLLTDEDGVTKKVSLPTAPLRFSETPTPTEAPYYSYDIEISNDGYYTKSVYNLPIFDGVDTTLPVSMIPREDGVRPPSTANLDTQIFEDLEAL